MSLSTELFEKAQSLVPGGVNSPVRSFASVGGTPLYVTAGSGARLTTIEGRELIDFCGSWGPLILGHAHWEVLSAVNEAFGRGCSFGINTPLEVEFAVLINTLVPEAEKIRLVNSGTEAGMTALRISRGATGRRKILKFDGHYHGHSDSLLVQAGSGLLTGGLSSSAGIAPETASDTLVCPWNDVESFATLMEEKGAEIAAVILEPIAGNMGVVPAAEGFLKEVRLWCDRCGSVMIADEVITGFRLAPTTFTHSTGIIPDLLCLGKILGGGMPIGGVAGKKELMDILAPSGTVYQAGTLSGNPIALTAGLTTLKILERDNPYPIMESFAESIAAALNPWAQQRDMPFHIARRGGMFTPFFRTEEVCNLSDARSCDSEGFRRYFHRMVEEGIYLPPSPFETAFVSAAHTKDDCEFFIEKSKQILMEIYR